MINIHYKLVVIFLLKSFLLVTFCNINSSYASSFNRSNNKENIIDLLAKSLEASSTRQSILAENIANARTPGYKAKDLNIKKYINPKLDVVRINHTHKMHITTATRNKKNAVFNSGGVPKPNGNTVDIAQESIKVAQNQDFYSESIKSYSTLMSLLSSVINTNGN